MMTFSKKHRLYLFLGGGVLVVLGFVALVRAGYYPVLLVNGEPVSAARFRRDYRSAGIYSQNFLKAYPLAGAALNTPSSAELQREVLNRLVDAALIRQAARREIGNVLASLVGERVAKYDGNETLQKAAEALYGMSYPDFREDVLVPQARRDILAGRFFLKGRNVETWLEEARKSARITVLSQSFRWDGENIVGSGS